jgi:ferric-dicitrate binding protein FerR (iron transport regulator)
MVLSIEGTASAQRGGADTPLEIRSRVYESDVVSTGAESNLQILLDDETSLTLGPGSTLDLIEFSEAEGGEKFEAKLAAGNMRVITGETTERNPDGFKITTRHAAVAIRGSVLSLATNDDFTRVDVESAKRQVLINGREITEFNRMTIHADGSEEITPLTVGERADDSRLPAAAQPALAVEDASLPTVPQSSEAPASQAAEPEHDPEPVQPPNPGPGAEIEPEPDPPLPLPL